MKPETELINYKELQKLIKLRTNYKLYEIEDILNALIVEVTEAMQNDKRVRLDQFVIFEPRSRGEKKVHSPIMGVSVSKPKRTMKISLSSYLKKAIDFPKGD